MIAKSILLFLLLIVLPDAYLHGRYLRRRRWWVRVLWWLPAAGMTAFAVKLSMEANFLPDRPAEVYAFLFLFGLIVVPKLLFSLCSLLGWSYCKLFGKRRHYANLLGLALVLIEWYVLFYGSFVGFQKLEVRHAEYASADLPREFDGYRILLFSDAHVGTYTDGREALLRQAVDSINAQHADLIAFAGDLQNIRPQDIYRHRQLLSTLKSRDGVYSVLGNHDYAEYVGGPAAVKVANCRETQSLERQMGWTLLMNEHCRIEREGASIVVAGMENDGEGRFPHLGDISKTLEGTAEGDFIVMLEHDPTAWRRNILPHSRAQLTLAGHTHAMQFALFGWSPVCFRYREYDGLYREGDRALYVSKGLGGVVPFRFGATGEIVVITLRSLPSKP